MRSVNDLVQGQTVQLQTNDAWNGLIGTVEHINYRLNIAYIFCIQFPNYTYQIGQYNINNVKKAFQ